VKIAIIGGSLLGEITGFKKFAEEKVKTPFGEPSDHYTIGEINDCEIIYFNRHGNEHHLAPHQINYRANIFVLKMLEVTHIIAVTAVGGITDKMSPMQWVVPDQLIDYTYGRMQTYNDGNEHEVNHIDFTFPFENKLREHMIAAVEQEDMKCLSKATYGATQGPRLETIAEIDRMEKDGCDIVGMTAMPEAALARELEMNYATLSLVVNWAAGREGTTRSTDASNGKSPDQTSISMDEITKRIADGNKIVEKIMNNVIMKIR
jgi:5'-deoxy-5'-methylthioadenosine phosphorylase